MPKFGTRSERILKTVDPRLVSVLRDVILHVDFTVLTGRRGKDAQTEAWATGRSKVRWPDSKHNCPLPEAGVPKRNWKEDPKGLSLAVDIAPWPIDWDDHRQFAFLAGQVTACARRDGLPLRWGGDWDGDGQGNWRDFDSYFNDLPHFEIIDD